MQKIRAGVAVILVFFLLVISSKRAEASTFVSLQIHNPTGGKPTDPEPAGVKSQFIFSNDSTSLTNIVSILFEFASPIFIDSTAAAPGVGGFRNFEVAPADVYGGTGTGEFETTVLDNSDVLTGYTGPTSLLDGATSLLLTFDHFEPTEAFGLWTDIDGDATGRVGNTHFNGTTTKITLSDDSVIDYTWVLPDNDGRSFFAQVEGGENVVPEPATLLLLGGGLLGAFVRKRRVV